MLLNDLYDLVPMDPEIETVELTGAELREMLEKNLEGTYSHDPLRQMGGYVKRALGLKAYFKAENPKEAACKPCSCRTSPWTRRAPTRPPSLPRRGCPTSLAATAAKPASTPWPPCRPTWPGTSRW